MAEQLEHSEVKCPHCDASVAVAEEPTGGSITCPECGGYFKRGAAAVQTVAAGNPPHSVSQLFERARAATLDDLLSEERKDLLAVVEALHRQEGQLAEVCAHLRHLRLWLAMVCLFAGAGLFVALSLTW